MTVLTSSTGETRDVEVDLDAVMAYEAAHPEWSLSALLEGLDVLRFTQLDLLARFFGFGSYKEFIDEGYTMKDLADAVTGSKYLGFTSAED